MTRRLHLLGIGGSGLSGIATVLAERGVDVSGCDRDSGGHDPAHLAPGMQVGYSGAVPDDEPELVEARRLGLELFHRADLLAEIVESGEGIAVAGSHGKTTTSGMIAFVLAELGEDPTYVVGGSLPQLGANARSGAGRHVVVEADESDGSLVRLRPRIAVILNVSHDHHDRYATRGELLDLLDGWIRSLAPGAAAVLPDGIDVGDAPVTRFGLGEGEGWRALHATSDAAGARFVLRRPGASDLEVSLSVPGVHNAGNAAAALAALDLAGVAPERAAPVLGRFTGAGRRFETVGVARGVRFVDDYGHHPNEIAATLRVAREQAGTGRVILCLLPHQPFRVRHLRRELAEATMHADLACVLDVWVARGQPEEGIDGKLVVDEVLRLDPTYPVAWTPDFDDAALWLAARTRPGDLVVGMGCGPVYEAGRRLMERLA
jgi:UDP-N-acetylmuramate--alanine ligase